MSKEAEMEVTQEDREAAATVYEALLHSTDCRALNARLGRMDDLDTVQAFARHRAQALATARAEIAAKDAEIARLREALERIANAYLDWNSDRVRYLRMTAAQALAQGSQT